MSGNSGPLREFASVEAWRAEAVRLFGPYPKRWRFVCPSCGHVARTEDWKKAGAPSTAVAVSCVGRWTGAGDDRTFGKRGGPCNYAGGGLIRLNPVRIAGFELGAFDFAPETENVPS